MAEYAYIERFKKLGFGMFVHFGLYSLIGRGEWNLFADKVEPAKYRAHSEKFLVKKTWARELAATAKAAGCRYVTLTTRHHDGFSLYDTRGLSPFDAPHSACGRDLIAEFVAACRQCGIVPLFYHTLLDWQHPDYRDNFPAYIDYLVGSIETLCKNYGKIGGFWFDGMWDKPDENWQEDRLYGTIRQYQPEAMIINNTGLDALGQTGHREIDSVTFERGKPFRVDAGDKPIAGEVCEGITDHWGYAQNDICHKSVRELLSLLLSCRVNGCNLLLNTGLKGDGSLDELEKGIFLALGKWISANRQFIYTAVPSRLQAENAVVLEDADCYYAVIKDVPMQLDSNVSRAKNAAQVTLKTDKKILSAKWLDNGKAIKVENNSFTVCPFEYGTSLALRVAKIVLSSK
ncbi:MAG: alpha-L-fucosidase [Clostridiales bacterium]|jgi:alpha-L-fucosidase|nr:alpha-L-fucosidase [Clostridiales bacterium]